MEFLLILSTIYNLYFYLKLFNISEPLLNIGIIGFLIWIFFNLTKIIFINNHCTNLYSVKKDYIYLYYIILYYIIIIYIIYILREKLI